MQVCTSLQTDNHASTPPLSFFTGRMPFLLPNQQHQSTEGKSAKNNETNKNGGNVKIPHEKTMLKVMKNIVMPASPFLSESY